MLSNFAGLSSDNNVPFPRADVRRAIRKSSDLRGSNNEERMVRISPVSSLLMSDVLELRVAGILSLERRSLMPWASLEVRTSTAMSPGETTPCLSGDSVSQGVPRRSRISFAIFW